jgi:glutathione synthase/RimK-type ligase-like ATP-grasp enzyme
VIPLYILTDYKNRFGLKWADVPYRSGFDLRALAESFAEHNYAVEYVPCAEALSAPRPWKGRLVLYTSCEEKGDNYKSYIEDVVHALSEAGACLVPRFAFLRAHNDKVFMEFLRDRLLGEELTGIKSRCFGTVEELAVAIGRGEIAMPCVLKSALGCMSRGVVLARDAQEAIRLAKRLGRTPHRLYEWRDFLRTKKNPGYLRESRHQGKFIVQPLIPGLAADWKVLVYGDQYYVLQRHVRAGDFRASGSGTDYRAGRRAEIPDAALELVEEAYRRLDVPHLSADVAFDGRRPYLFEFQALYFGTATQAEYCKDYFVRRGDRWECEKNTLSQEAVLAWSATHYLRRHPELLPAC